MSTAIAVATAEPERILICAAAATFAVAMNDKEEIAAATAADNVLIMISSTVEAKFLPTLNQASLENWRIKHVPHDTKSARI
jgi:hypothetical protein